MTLSPVYWPQDLLGNYINYCNDYLFLQSYKIRYGFTVEEKIGFHCLFIVVNLRWNFQRVIHKGRKVLADFPKSSFSQSYRNQYQIHLLISKNTLLTFLRDTAQSNLKCFKFFVVWIYRFFRPQSSNFVKHDIFGFEKNTNINNVTEEVSVLISFH